MILSKTLILRSVYLLLKFFTTFCFVISNLFFYCCKILLQKFLSTTLYFPTLKIKLELVQKWNKRKLLFHKKTRAFKALVSKNFIYLCCFPFYLHQSEKEVTFLSLPKSISSIICRTPSKYKNSTFSWLTPVVLLSKNTTQLQIAAVSV